MKKGWRIKTEQNERIAEKGELKDDRMRMWMNRIQRVKEDELQMANYKVRTQKFGKIKGKINEENRTKRIICKK